MSVVTRVLAEAKAAAAVTLKLARATGRPASAAQFAALRLARRDQPVDLVWRQFRLAARGRDWPALDEVLIEHEYAPLARYLTARPTPIVLDLGANIGTFALYAFSLAPAARVLSFEPSATTYDILAATRARNPGVAWEVHRAAAWRADGNVTFAEGALSTAGRVAPEGGGETVPAWSLARIVKACGGRIDVAKIDIEGAEEAVLCASEAELARIATVVVELHPDRCDTARVASALRASYGRLHRIPGRKSSKPLLLATRAAPAPDLPAYLD
jgi:FkbM family methyltransferase